MDSQIASLEALLFIHGEPLAFKKIQVLLEIDSLEEVLLLITELKNRLESAERGLALVQDEEKVQLVTKPVFGKLIENFVKEELSEDLTSASVETLAVISYFGPISRSRIEYIRGVNSTFILRSLLMRGLIERSTDPQNANAFVYQPSFELLRHLGIDRKETLPEYSKFQELVRKFETGEAEPPPPPPEASVPPEVPLPPPPPPPTS